MRKERRYLALSVLSELEEWLLLLTVLFWLKALDEKTRKQATARMMHLNCIKSLICFAVFKNSLFVRKNNYTENK
jgi:hypothetical protein